MSESWSTIYGDDEPTCSEDLKRALQQASDSRAIRFKNKSIHRKIARDLWAAFDGDGLRVIDKVNRALECGSYNAEAYLLKCCENEPPDRQPESEKTPRGTGKNNLSQEKAEGPISGYGSDDLEALCALNNEFRATINYDPDADPDCPACGGTGFEVDWFPSGLVGNLPFGKYGHCRECLPDKAEPNGIGKYYPNGFKLDPDLKKQLDKFPQIAKKLELPKEAWSKPGFIYFIHDEVMDMVKIGWSIDPSKRLKELQTGSPNKLTLIHKIPGVQSDEAVYHKRFSRLLERGEWFRLDAPLSDLVLPVRTQKGWVKFYRSIEEHWTYQDSRHWPFKVFSHLILNAVHKTTVIYKFGQKIILRRGDIDCTEKQLADRFKVSRISIHRFLEKLEENGEISRRKIPRKKYTNSLVGEQGPEQSTEHVPVLIDEPINNKGPVVGFTIITLLKYKDYQNSDVKGYMIGYDNGEQITEARPEQSTEHEGEQLLKNKEIKKEETQTPPTPSKAIKPITATGIFEIWDEHKGKLQPVIYRSSNQVIGLMNTLNEVYPDDPCGKWKEIVQRASECHKSHRQFMTLGFMAKDPNKIIQILDGMYDRSFGGSNGKRKDKEPSRVHAEHFGIEGDAESRIEDMQRRAKEAGLPKV